MPTNRSKRKHRYEGIFLDSSIEEFFFTGKADRKTPGWNLRTSRFFGGPEIRDAWMQHGPYLLEKWRSEGRKGQPWILGEGGRYADE
jgi:hypothetical protein